ncbi:Glycoside hydrolase family 45 protein [Rhizoctonia solani]|uniref:Cellulase n=1 Tax=Rhizoctonia solani TaxID=456999 RepID=A0A8H7M9C8_9AGAM|nr:Glycoside hydrolase family 45 protein [Rhizoctonia solani]
MKLAISLATAVFGALTVVNAQSGTGATTRYWDCCKESCGWSGKANVNAPVRSCDKNNNPLSDYNAQSGCGSGGAYACANHSPWAVNDNLSYGFAAVKLQGGHESTWCCQCYELTFTSGPVSGKKMIVQTTNTGGDLGNNHFDLMIPGGGVGIFGQGCASQYGHLLQGGCTVWRRFECSQLPSALQAGCNWRFDWFQNADNPSVSFKQVTCPSQLTSITGCSRK